MYPSIIPLQVISLKQNKQRVKVFKSVPLIHPPDKASIRRAEPEDARRVAQIYLQARKVFLPYAPLTHREADVQSWVQNHLIPQGNVFVREAQGQIQAFLAVSDDGNTRWIDHLYVIPGAEGQGLGSELMRWALPQLRSPVQLYCFKANHGARRFYERLGFRAKHFGGGREHEEGVPDVLYCRSGRKLA